MAESDNKNQEEQEAAQEQQEQAPEKTDAQKKRESAAKGGSSEVFSHEDLREQVNDPDEPDNPIGHEALQGNPEPDAVGQLEYLVGVDPEDEKERQQQENYPRLPREYFDPHGADKAELREIRPLSGTTAQSNTGRLVTIDYDVLFAGEVFKAGTVDLPVDTAEALIEAGYAFEPSGKGMGRG